MIWACFTGNKLGPIVFINGTLNSSMYIDILRQNLLPFLDVLIADGATNVAFQQDNAPPHASKITRGWLQEVLEERGVMLIDWPANSPDMSPIENLWARLKLELHRRYPDTAIIRGGPDAIKWVLIERLMEVWWAIGE